MDNRLLFKLSLFFGCIPPLMVVLGYTFARIRTLTVSNLVIFALLGGTLILLDFVFFFFIYKFTFAYFWNCRAKRLRNSNRDGVSG